MQGRVPGRGVVVSNCQSVPLKQALTLLCRDLVFDHFGVHVIGPDREAEIAAFVDAARRDYDHIVSVHLSDDFGPLAGDRIRDTFAGQAVTLVANIYHAGLHPDLVYIGGLADRLLGPLNDYHSRVALIAYLAGLSADAAVGLYRLSTYEQLDFFTAHERSIAELVAREAPLDVPVSPLILDLFREVPILMAVNHPTAALLWPFAERIAAHLEQAFGVEPTGWAGGPAQFANELAFSDIFPVYPELAEHHGLRYPGSLLFKPQAAGGQAVRPLTLADYVAAEYASFASIGRAALEASHQGVEIRHRYGALDLAAA